MAKECVGAWILPLRCSLFLLPNYYAIIMQYFSYIDERGVLKQEYSQPPNTPLFSLLVGSILVTLPDEAGSPLPRRIAVDSGQHGEDDDRGRREEEERDEVHHVEELRHKRHDHRPNEHVPHAPPLGV